MKLEDRFKVGQRIKIVYEPPGYAGPCLGDVGKVVRISTKYIVVSFKETWYFYDCKGKENHYHDPKTLRECLCMVGKRYNWIKL